MNCSRRIIYSDSVHMQKQQGKKHMKTLFSSCTACLTSSSVVKRSSRFHDIELLRSFFSKNRCKARNSQKNKAARCWLLGAACTITGNTRVVLIALSASLGQGHHTEVQVFRIPGDVVLAHLGGILQECLNVCRTTVEGEWLASIQVIDLAIDICQANEV